MADKQLPVEFHTSLNPKIWDGDTLNFEVKERLLAIAEAFMEFLNLDIDVEDIILTGSLANFNYTDYSDFDLHILTDFSSYDIDTELLKDYFSAKKTIWNTTREIRIKGYPVELYVQDSNEPHYSTGVYSLKDDSWITVPKVIATEEDIDLDEVENKRQAMLDLIEFALTNECDIECAEKAKEKFMNFRKVGLESGGEYSAENIAYKQLRRSGDIERLLKGIMKKKSMKLSLDSVQESLAPMSFKGLWGISGGKGSRGEHHTKLGAGMSTKRKKLSIVAKDHSRLKGPNVDVHNMKKKTVGMTPITDIAANQIIARYDLDPAMIKSGKPRKLSTSGIEIGFNPTTNTFYLRKY